MAVPPAEAVETARPAASVDRDSTATNVQKQHLLYVNEPRTQAYTASLPRATYLEEAVLKKKRDMISQLVWDTYYKLRATVDKCGADMLPIISTVEGRQGLLQSLSPPLPARLSPDFEPLKPDNSLQELGDMQYKKVFKRACYLPHLNVEELAKDNNLYELLFEKYVNNFPSDTALSALELSHINLDSPAVRKSGLEYYMAFWNCDSRGKFDAVFDPMQIYERAKQGKDKPMVKSYAGIEMMQWVLEELQFIAQVWRAAGFDFTQTELAQTSAKAIPPYTRVVREFESLGNISNAAPYRKQASIDFARLGGHVTAQLDAAVTHLMDLQSDPIYLKRTLQESAEHLPLLMIYWQDEAAGGLRPTVGCLATYKILNDAYSEVVWWALLQQLIKDANFWMTAEAEAWETCNLSERCIRVFSQLSHVLNVMIAVIGSDLGHAVPCLKKMRAQYEEYPGDAAKPQQQWTVLAAVLKQDANSDAAYLHCLTRMLFHNEARSCHGPWHITRALEAAIEQDAKGEQYFTPRLAESVSKISLLAELKRQLFTAQPQTTMWRNEDQTAFKQEVDWVLQSPLNTIDRTIWQRANDCGFELDEPAFANLGSDSVNAAQNLPQAHACQDDFLKSLWVMLGHTGDKRIRGDEVTSALRTPARAIRKGTHDGIQSTDLEGVFEQICENLGWGFGDRAYDFENPASTPTSTAEELRPLSPPLETGAPPPEDAHSSGDARSPLRNDSVVSTTASQTPVALPIISRPKVPFDPATTADRARRFVPEFTKKEKRRDAALATVTGPAAIKRIVQGVLHAPAEPYEGTIAVDTRALDALQVMNLVPGTAAGQVEWSEVLHAMRAAGFNAEQSAEVIWKFQRGDRSITAHRPHPGSKWAKEQAQDFGRRLNRTYGFTKETFVLREG